MAVPLIVWRDMHRRDMDVLDWLKSRAETVDGASIARAKQQNIADDFGCHRNTVGRIINRLVGARQIEVIDRDRESYVYKIVSQ